MSGLGAEVPGPYGYRWTFSTADVGKPIEWRVSRDLYGGLGWVSVRLRREIDDQGVEVLVLDLEVEARR